MSNQDSEEEEAPSSPGKDYAKNAAGFKYILNYLGPRLMLLHLCQFKSCFICGCANGRAQSIVKLAVMSLCVSTLRAPVCVWIVACDSLLMLACAPLDK